jgi:predicted transglutaminase-like cysteine proteinase
MAGLIVLVAMTAGAAGTSRAEQFSMKVSGWTNPPVGYVDFCRHYPQECEAHGPSVAEDLTSERWRDLRQVNSHINHSIVPATDLAYYKTEEVWTLPDAYGDCEDYVLLKRKRLIERGWPTGTLLVTVVFDEVGDGHAVLLARTTRGDFVLDNKTDDILAWYDTRYRFVKRQSVADPNRWVAVGDPRWATQSTAAPR